MPELPQNCSWKLWKKAISEYLYCTQLHVHISWLHVLEGECEQLPYKVYLS